MTYHMLAYTGALVLLAGSLVGCGSTGPTPGLPPTPPGPDPGTVQGGPPPGVYSCMHRYTIWNGTFSEHYAFHVDDLKILSGGRYRSNLSDEESRYSYDAATRAIRYTGVYLDEGYIGLYEPAEARDDGLHNIENVTQVDGENFTVNCLSK